MTTTDTAIATTLKARETVAEGTMAFHFDKPDGFRFKAGQAVDLVVGDQRHAFSIVTAPSESEIVIATRMRGSEFKRVLKATPIGGKVGIDGPFGSLTLHKDPTRAAILIAGGIGITPYVSMLRQATADRLAHRIVLIYSVRRPSDAAFLDELRDLAARNSNFRLVVTVTQPETAGQGWKGETGHVDKAMLARATRELSPRPIHYLAGPPAMVAGLKRVLGNAGVVDDDIRAEEFFGY